MAGEERIGWGRGGGSGIVSWGKGCGTRDTCARSHLIVSEKPSRGERAAIWRSWRMRGRERPVQEARRKDFVVRRK